MNTRHSINATRRITTTLAAVAGWIVLALITAKIAHAISGHDQPWVYIPFAVIGLSVLVYGGTRSSEKDGKEDLD